MANKPETGAPEESAEISRAAALLGGMRVLGHPLRNQLDVHEVIDHGLPRAALLHLVAHSVFLIQRGRLEACIGMSLRTFQRLKIAPRKSLSKEQGGRMWNFVEVLAKATKVLGSQEEAERWLERPAIGLDQRRPIDLLATSAGLKVVEEHLDRLEYGVYA